MSLQPWSPTLLAQADDAYDVDRASDGHSRYGVYLSQHPDWFRDYDTWNPVPPAEFAASAWRVATAPLMVPGYVRIRPDLAGITAHVDEENSDRLIVEIAVPLGHGDLTARVSGWRDWQTDSYDVAGDGTYTPLIEPDFGQAVLATATVRLILTELHAPSHVEGPGLTGDARRAVQLLADQINAQAGGIVHDLHGRPPART
jgi:hypothetical protein